MYINKVRMNTNIINKKNRYRCIHNFNKSNCKVCSPQNYCIHNKQKRYCIDCKGSGICIHLKNGSIFDSNNCNLVGFLKRVG